MHSTCDCHVVATHLKDPAFRCCRTCRKKSRWGRKRGETTCDMRQGKVRTTSRVTSIIQQRLVLQHVISIRCLAACGCSTFLWGGMHDMVQTVSNTSEQARTGARLPLFSTPPLHRHTPQHSAGSFKVHSDIHPHHDLLVHTSAEGRSGVETVRITRGSRPKKN